MKPAILVVDMVKDAFREKDTKARGQYLQVVPNIQKLLRKARTLDMPIVYACDSFLENDFIFQGKRGFCIRGTEGAGVIDELKPEAGDLVLPKRRFSAFFKTFLEQDLRMKGVDTVVVTGINTEGCVYPTALDAIANDFCAIILEDCSASYDRQNHEQCIDLLSRSRLFPLLSIMSGTELLHQLDSTAYR